MDFLVIPFLFLLFGSMILTVKTRFIQFRCIPHMFKLLFSSIFHKQKTSEHTIKAHQALFTAMATTLGVGNIVAPVFAIGIGGPGALLGFVIASIFGAATAFTEVSFALSFRKTLPDGSVAGGPMQYLRYIHPWLAAIYAVSGSIMLISWSGRQTNVLATQLATYDIPTYATGIVVAGLTAFMLLRGIKIISQTAEKLVPTMFVLYAGSMTYILICNAHNIPMAFKAIFQSAFTPEAFVGAGVGLGLQKALRWGLSEATFSNEAGVGTITIPHSMAETKNSVDQGILSMISVHTSGVLALITGLAILSSGVWLTPNAHFDITMIADVLRNHFSFVGPIILLLTVVMFAFTTIIGNSFNGSQCFSYITKNRWIKWYYMAMALLVLFCAMVDANTLWALGGYFILPVAIPNIIGLIILAFRRGDLLKKGL